MSSKIHRTQIYLREEQYDYLIHEAEAKGISLAECIRRIVDERLGGREDYYKENPLFEIGKDGFADGRKDGSKRHDEYIYKGAR